MESYDARNPESRAKAVEALKRGRVVCAPTDTVYGLLADATNPAAIRRVMEIKRREPGKPLPVFVKDIEEASRYAEITEAQERFLRLAWPGKVTAVLKNRGVLPQEMGIGETIGLRVPGHPLIQEILERAGVPLTGTSANLAGNPSLSSAGAVAEEFSGKEAQPDILLDAGALPPSAPSRVVDLTGGQERVLRP